jgi:hypothetical protein
MFREKLDVESSTDVLARQWPVPVSPTPRAAARAAVDVDEVGAVWHVYREIARRIPRNAFTRHESTLGDALS